MKRSRSPSVPRGEAAVPDTQAHTEPLHPLTFQHCVMDKLFGDEKRLTALLRENKMLNMACDPLNACAAESERPCIGCEFGTEIPRRISTSRACITENLWWVKFYSNCMDDTDSTSYQLLFSPQLTCTKTQLQNELLEVIKARSTVEARDRHPPFSLFVYYTGKDTFTVDKELIITLECLSVRLVPISYTQWTELLQ